MSDFYRAIADGTGGAILGAYGASGVLVQRLSASGEVQWGNGVLVVGDAYDQSFRLVADGFGGVFVFTRGTTDAYVAHLDANGQQLGMLVPLGGNALFRTP